VSPASIGPSAPVAPDDRQCFTDDRRRIDQHVGSSFVQRCRVLYDGIESLLPGQRDLAQPHDAHERACLADIARRLQRLPENVRLSAALLESDKRVVCVVETPVRVGQKLGDEIVQP
jgi:hypothetical protein